MDGSFFIFLKTIIDLAAYSALIIMIFAFIYVRRGGVIQLGYYEDDEDDDEQQINEDENNEVN